LPITSKDPKKKWIWILCIVSFLLICVGAYSGYQFYQHKDLVAPQKLTLSNKRSAEVNIKKDPFIVLLMGTDGRSAQTHNWRPDVLMLAAVNPSKKSIKLVSVPRDLYVEIANTDGAKDKINASAAYAYQKGIDPILNVRETVENLFNIPIDYYAKVNFQGFMDIVDLMGGVDVNVAFPFHMKAIGGETVYFQKGPAHLDGHQALAYVRMRHDDPNGDAGRNKRQREVIQILIDKLASFDTVPRFMELVSTVSNNFQHSFAFSEIPTLAKIYSESKQNLTEVTLKTTPSRKFLGGVYAYIEKLSEEERLHISTMLQNQIEYKPKQPIQQEDNSVDPTAIDQPTPNNKDNITPKTKGEH
jgi:LCP family protein required for cell wall assembly